MFQMREAVTISNDSRIFPMVPLKRPKNNDLLLDIKKKGFILLESPWGFLGATVGPYMYTYTLTFFMF